MTYSSLKKILTSRFTNYINQRKLKRKAYQKVEMLPRTIERFSGVVDSWYVKSDQIHEFIIEPGSTLFHKRYSFTFEDIEWFVSLKGHQEHEVESMTFTRNSITSVLYLSGLEQSGVFTNPEMYDLIIKMTDTLNSEYLNISECVEHRSSLRRINSEYATRQPSDFTASEFISIHNAEIEKYLSRLNKDI